MQRWKICECMCGCIHVNETRTHMALQFGDFSPHTEWRKADTRMILNATKLFILFFSLSKFVYFKDLKKRCLVGNHVESVRKLYSKMKGALEEPIWAPPAISRKTRICNNTTRRTCVVYTHSF